MAASLHEKNSHTVWSVVRVNRRDATVEFPGLAQNMNDGVSVDLKAKNSSAKWCRGRYGLPRFNKRNSGTSFTWGTRDFCLCSSSAVYRQLVRVNPVLRCLVGSLVTKDGGVQPPLQAKS